VEGGKKFAQLGAAVANAYEHQIGGLREGCISFDPDKWHELKPLSREAHTLINGDANDA
jgi:hypothetical protein